jgi:pimeloyl-ACP methyl ester carboxylesterase
LRYPVIYYLHGGNGSQREGSWLIEKMDEAMFGFTSSLAGAVINWEDEHNTQYLVNTFGPNDPDHVADSKEYFDSVHPRVFAAQNLELIKGYVGIRLLVGDQDWLYKNRGNDFITRNFSNQLTTLGIDYEYTVIPGVGHMLPDEVAAGNIQYPIEFWQKAFQQFK